MERPISKPIGAAVEELDTPALVVDLDMMERNIAAVHSFFRDREARIRPHVEVHRCPAIARRQLDVEGAAGGIAVATVGEAEVFAEHGFDDILVANEIVSRSKIARLCALATGARISVAVDSPVNVGDLSEASQGCGAVLNVLVDVNTSPDRPGVGPGRPAADLARTVAEAAGLRFAGLMAYEGPVLTDARGDMADGLRKGIEPLLDTREMVERQGLDAGTVSVVGTLACEAAGGIPGITEVIAGAYALLDGKHAATHPQLNQAAKVLTTVISHPEPGRALTDAGQKAMGMDTGTPSADDTPGAKLDRMSAEHGWLDLEGGAQRQVDLGAKIWLTPWDIGNCVNSYDYINAARGGKLEAVWRVAARGRYR